MAAPSHTKVVWRERMTFDATTTTGHHMALDVLPPGGNDRGPKPMELLLVALAGCTAMDVLSILIKKRQRVVGLEVFVEGSRASEHPMVYDEIQVVYRVRGKVTQEALARAIQLSETKYCGVNAMLSSRARITSRYELEATDGASSGAEPAKQEPVLAAEDE